MSPLDLTVAPPRSPKEQLDGLCMLPRMIDIARANLSGGRPGGYQIGRGLSRLVLRTIGTTAARFIEIVGESSNDPDVARRLRLDERRARCAQLNARLKAITVADVPPDLRADFERAYGPDLSPERVVFDLLEADDSATFGERVSLTK